MTFKIIPSGSQWYFNIVASNHRVRATSERYWNRADAVHAAQLIMRHAASGTVTY